MKDELTKYAKGEISSEELSGVASLVESASDSELEEIISSQWQEFDSDESLSKAKRTSLYPKAAIRHSKYISPCRYMLAGIVLVLVLMGFIFSFNGGRASYKRLASANVKMETGAEGIFTLILPDGSSAMLNSRSKVSYPSNFGMENREMYLRGEGYFEVSSDPSKEFIVHTGKMDIKVHGTKFNVFAYEGGTREEIFLLEGSVSVKSNGHTEKLVPGQKLTVDSRGVRVSIADPKTEMAWMDNTLVFMHEPLKKVFDALERKYGVVITCSPEINLSDRYTGSFDDFRVADVLNVLKMHYGFKCVFNGNKVMIIP